MFERFEEFEEFEMFEKFIRSSVVCCQLSVISCLSSVVYLQTTL